MKKILSPILEDKELEPRDVGYLTQSDTATKW